VFPPPPLVGGGEGEGERNIKKNQKQISFARELRQKQTDSEKALWQKLRDKQFEGIKFRRQQPVGPYIVDFISPKEKIIIEIDGGQHNEKEIQKKDEERTVWLEKEGYLILRFWNNEVLFNPGGVLERIREAIEEGRNLK